MPGIFIRLLKHARNAATSRHLANNDGGRRVRVSGARGGRVTGFESAHPRMTLTYFYLMNKSEIGFEVADLNQTVGVPYVSEVVRKSCGERPWGRTQEDRARNSQLFQTTCET